MCSLCIHLYIHVGVPWSKHDMVIQPMESPMVTRLSKSCASEICTRSLRRAAYGDFLF